MVKKNLLVLGRREMLLWRVTNTDGLPVTKEEVASLFGAGTTVEQPNSKKAEEFEISCPILDSDVERFSSGGYRVEKTVPPIPWWLVATVLLILAIGTIGWIALFLLVVILLCG